MASEQHHHRSTTKTVNKPFKTKHSSKGAIKERQKGKVESLTKGSRKTPHQQVLTKLDRRNQAKQKRISHNAEHVRATTLFTGKDAAPRNVVVIGLSRSISPQMAVTKLLRSLDISDPVPAHGAHSVEVARFKQRLRFCIPRSRDLFEALDLCRAADYVAFVMGADEEVDDLGEATLRTIESQGVSTVLSLVQDLASTGTIKKQHQVQASLKSFITHFFNTQEKVHSLDSIQECLNVVRSLCSSVPKGINWREMRSWMAIEDVLSPTATSSTFSITGVIRGKGLKADRLLQIGDWGTFQIDSIHASPLDLKRKAGSMDVEATPVLLDEQSPEVDELADLAPEVVTMVNADDTTASIAPSERRGVLLDDHHYFQDEDEGVTNVSRRLPKGTSKYQSAWYLDDVSDSGSDLESMDLDDDDESGEVAAHPADGTEGHDEAMANATEGAPSEYPQSEMFLDPAPEDEAEQLASYRASRKVEAEDDLEFPDEIELHPNVLARERLARYRGLKSLRTSVWEREEDRPYQPEEWDRLLDISNYKAARNRFTNEAHAGGVSPGTRATVVLRSGDRSAAEIEGLPRPIGAFSLLRHEQKRTVMNYSMTLSADYPEPLKSKAELIMQCGPRRHLVRPIYSQTGHAPNNIHKFDRYLHPGQTATASVIAPLTWGSVPVLFFVKGEYTDDEGKVHPPSSLRLVATGTSLAPSTARVVAKRAILTGHPYKIHKRLVTIRYMFFNREDVEWFRALQLWTRRGRSGFIKEALGTHGYLKATFDGPINPLDAVAVSLYKRVFPRWAIEYKPTRPAEAGPDNGGGGVGVAAADAPPNVEMSDVTS